MGKRKDIRSIANGIIGSFVSRNNDVYGYWGIGKLYKLMILKSTLEVQIDLLHRSMQPSGKEFQLLIDSFSDKLKAQVLNRGLDPDSLIKAVIILTCCPGERSPFLGKIAPNKMICSISLTDDLDRVHSSEAIVWCRVHNPLRESKSAREY